MDTAHRSEGLKLVIVIQFVLCMEAGPICIPSAVSEHIIIVLLHKLQPCVKIIMYCSNDKAFFSYAK